MSATIQDEFHPKQILKLTGQGFSKIQLFDDVNFPTLICVFKHFPNSPEVYNNNDATNYKLYLSYNIFYKDFKYLFFGARYTTDPLFFYPKKPMLLK